MHKNKLCQGGNWRGLISAIPWYRRRRQQRECWRRCVLFLAWPTWGSRRLGDGRLLIMYRAFVQPSRRIDLDPLRRVSDEAISVTKKYTALHAVLSARNGWGKRVCIAAACMKQILGALCVRRASWIPCTRSSERLKVPLLSNAMQIDEPPAKRQHNEVGQDPCRCTYGISEASQGLKVTVDDEDDMGLRVAESVLMKYLSLPKTGKPQPNEHTVLCGFVLSRGSCAGAEMCCVALGTGTKCLGGGKRSADGDLLNDSHAVRQRFLACLLIHGG